MKETEQESSELSENDVKSQGSQKDKNTGQNKNSKDEGSADISMKNRESDKNLIKSSTRNSIYKNLKSKFHPCLTCFENTTPIHRLLTLRELNVQKINCAEIECNFSWDKSKKTQEKTEEEYLKELSSFKEYLQYIVLGIINKYINTAWEAFQPSKKKKNELDFQLEIGKYLKEKNFFTNFTAFQKKIEEKGELKKKEEEKIKNLTLVKISKKLFKIVNLCFHYQNDICFFEFCFGKEKKSKSEQKQKNFCFLKNVLNLKNKGNRMDDNNQKNEEINLNQELLKIIFSPAFYPNEVREERNHLIDMLTNSDDYYLNMIKQTIQSTQLDKILDDFKKEDYTFDKIKNKFDICTHEFNQKAYNYKLGVVKEIKENEELTNQQKRNLLNGLDFYKKQIDNLKKKNYKISTIGFLRFCLKIAKLKREEMNEEKGEEEENETNINLKIITTLLSMLKKLISITNEKELPAVNQLISYYLIEINKNMEYLLKEKLSEIRDGEDSEIEEIEIEYIITFLALLNKIDTNIFILIKDKFKDEKTDNNPKSYIINLIEKILEYTSTNDFEEKMKKEIIQSRWKIKLRKHIILYYTKYHFLSIYKESDSDLLNAEETIPKLKKIKLIQKNMKLFKKIASVWKKTNEEGKNIASYWKNTVAIPSYLIIWKICYFCSLTGYEQYYIYKVLLWFYQCLIEILDCDFSKLLKKDKDKNETNNESIKEKVEEFLKELQKNKMEFLQESFREFIQKFIQVLSYFNFFPDQKENKKDEQKQKEDKIDEVIPFNKKINKFIEEYSQIKEEIKKEKRGKFLITNIFDENNENSEDDKKIAKNIIHALIQEIYPNENSYFEEFKNCDYSKYDILKAANYLFLINPQLYQRELLAFQELGKKILESFIEEQIFFFAQMSLTHHLNILPSKTEIPINFLIEELEFIRLLCEDHNPLFQTIFIHSNEFYPLKGKKENIVELSLEISKEIVLLQIHNLKQSYSTYLYGLDKFESLGRIEEKLTDFRVEVIQGTTRENLIKIAKFEDDCKKGENYFEEYLDAYIMLFDYFEIQNKTIIKLIEKFFYFLLCFCEESSFFKSVKIEKKKNISKANQLDNTIRKLTSKLNEKEMFNLGKKAIEIYLDNHRKEKNKKEKEEEDDDVSIKKIYSEEYKKIKSQNEEKKDEDPFFLIALNSFFYINRIADSHFSCKGKFKEKLEEIAESARIKDNKEEENKKMNKTSKLIYEMEEIYYLICSKLLLKNEVKVILNFKKWEEYCDKYYNLLGNEKESDIFSDIKDFEETTNVVTVFHKKLTPLHYLTEGNVKYFLDKEAKYDNYYEKLSGIYKFYQKLKEESQTSDTNKGTKLIDIRYKELEKYIILSSLILNLLFFFSNNLNIIYIIGYIFEMLFVVILICMIYQYIKLKMEKEKKKQLTEIKKKNKYLDIYIKSFSIIIKNPGLFFLLWNCVFGIFGLIFPFFFSFQLFSFFYWNETMFSALLAIYNRIDDFLSTLFLLAIIILFYAAVTIIYSFNYIEDTQTEICSSYLECGLYLFNSGLRSGGVPFEPKVSSQPGFLREFIYSWIFFFFIILIFMNIVNGIIVDTFQFLREKRKEDEDQKKNYCFICQLGKNKFESRNINFEKHFKEDHSVFNYFCYLQYIDTENPHDLNSVDYQVYQAYKEDKVDFFPIDNTEGIEEE